MRISGLNYTYSPNFTSRKKEIRDAQDICRKVSCNFPMASASYVERTYDCVSPNSKYSKKANKLNNLIGAKLGCSHLKMQLGIGAGDVRLEDGTEIPYAGDLNIAKNDKVGNCYEKSAAALATLSANGYYNCAHGNLYLVIECKDGETGDTIYYAAEDLDHAFVLTDMNKGGKQDVVIDPWYGFADSKEGAIARYKQKIPQEAINHAVINHLTELKNDKMCSDVVFNDKINFIRTKFALIPSEKNSKEDFELLGEYARNNYENILLQNEDKNEEMSGEQECA